MTLLPCGKSSHAAFCPSRSLQSPKGRETARCKKRQSSRWSPYPSATTTQSLPGARGTASSAAHLPCSRKGRLGTRHPRKTLAGVAQTLLEPAVPSALPVCRAKLLLSLCSWPEEGSFLLISYLDLILKVTIYISI